MMQEGLQTHYRPVDQGLIVHDRLGTWYIRDVSSFISWSCGEETKKGCSSMEDMNCTCEKNSR